MTIVILKFAYHRRFFLPNYYSHPKILLPPKNRTHSVSQEPKPNIHNVNWNLKLPWYHMPLCTARFVTHLVALINVINEVHAAK